MKNTPAQKENSRGMIPMFKDVLTVLSQFVDDGRKSFKNNSRSKVTATIGAPSGTSDMVIIEGIRHESGLDAIKLVSVVELLDFMVY